MVQPNFTITFEVCSLESCEFYDPCVNFHHVMCSHNWIISSKGEVLCHLKNISLLSPSAALWLRAHQPRRNWWALTAWRSDHKNKLKNDELDCLAHRFNSPTVLNEKKSFCWLGNDSRAPIRLWNEKKNEIRKAKLLFYFWVRAKISLER